jgi:hypothetical protein
MGCMAVTPTQLAKAQEAFETGRVAIEAARRHRNNLILQASDEGIRDVDIADASRLGKHRVRQIIVNETLPLDWVPDRRQLRLFDPPSPYRAGRLADS